MRKSIVWSVSVSVLVACGGTSEDADAGLDAAHDTGSDTGSPSGRCPAERPGPTESCEHEGLVCEYGARSCLSFAECVDGNWLVAVPRCPPMPPDGCPSTRAEAQGEACAGAEGSVCDVEGDLLCRCTSCPSPSPICVPVDPPVWACEAPNMEPGCPAAQPRLGTACAPEGQVCDYGCEDGARRVCVDGGWTRSSMPGGCPVSTQQAKRDIEYLDAAAVEALATAVETTRLATYEYTDPARSGRRRLGFILEDQAGSFAVDPEQSQVDLYGYTSMLVAAVQAQSRRIEELERELAAIRDARPPTRRRAR